MIDEHRPSKWQPINTAPTSEKGELLLMYDAFERKPHHRMYVGWMHFGQWVCHGRTNKRPTHWMPLPEPPKVEG